MNTLKTIRTVYYGRASRTIDTVLVSNNNVEKTIYVYNYEGYSFRVFETKKDLSNFCNLDIDSKFHFNSDEELDDYLIKMINYIED